MGIIFSKSYVDNNQSPALKVKGFECHQDRNKTVHLYVLQTTKQTLFFTYIHLHRNENINKILSIHSNKDDKLQFS